MRISFMKKNTLAREWLYFLGWIAAPTVGLPLVLKALDPDANVWEFYSVFWTGLFKRLEWTAWALLFGPYLVFQLIRSIRWAIRVLRTADSAEPGEGSTPIWLNDYQAVRDAFDRGLSRLLSNDAYLLEVDVNERSICHK